MLVTKLKDYYDKASLSHAGEKRSAVDNCSPPPKRARTAASIQYNELPE